MSNGLFDWAKFLPLAEELGKRPEEEALRSAVSRGYYAVFGTARARIQDLRETSRREAGDMHAQLWNEYTASKNADSKQIGLDADRLKRQRRKADYDRDISQIQRFTSDNLKLASALLNKIKNLPEGVPEE